MVPPSTGWPALAPTRSSEPGPSSGRIQRELKTPIDAAILAGRPPVGATIAVDCARGRQGQVALPGVPSQGGGIAAAGLGLSQADDRASVRVGF